MIDTMQNLNSESLQTLTSPWEWPSDLKLKTDVNFWPFRRKRHNQNPNLMRITKSDADNYDRAFRTLDGLADVVRRLTQEVEVLKEMLREKNVWDEQHYKRVMIERPINDHSSAGCNSDMFYAHYPYTLGEASFLKHRFKASDEEIAAFRNAVQDVEFLT